MSSNASSPLTLELEPAWVLLGAVCLWLALIVASFWSGATPAPLKLIVSVAVVCAGVLTLRSQMFGYSPHALVRVVWQQDGRWTLTDGRGQEWSAELCPAVRFAGEYALLMWKTEGGQRWVLLSGGANRVFFRRLRVRLRFG